MRFNDTFIVDLANLLHKHGKTMVFDQIPGASNNNRATASSISRIRKLAEDSDKYKIQNSFVGKNGKRCYTDEGENYLGY